METSKNMFSAYKALFFRAHGALLHRMARYCKIDFFVGERATPAKKWQAEYIKINFSRLPNDGSETPLRGLDN